MRRILHTLLAIMLGLLATVARGWSQTPPRGGAPGQASPIRAVEDDPLELPPGWSMAEFEAGPGSLISSALDSADPIDAGSLSPIGGFAAPTEKRLPNGDSSPAVSNAFAIATDTQSENPVRPIPSYVVESNSSHRIVRYEVPLDDPALHRAFIERGIEGQLIEVVDESATKDESISDRLVSFLLPGASRENSKKVRLVRYEVPATDIQFHAQLSQLDGELLEPGMLRLPEVRFFQPKARVFMDLKRSNDGEFDLFNNGAILASLDVIELYFPMPLVSERFAEMFGRPDRLASIGWRVGGTLGLGITTALNNGTADNGSAPVTTLSSGIRYEFPLGRPSREVLETRDPRLDQRTRVGMEFGVQGGVSTRESLQDATDVGLYFGFLVNTPWGS